MRDPGEVACVNAMPTAIVRIVLFYSSEFTTADYRRAKVPRCWKLIKRILAFVPYRVQKQSENSRPICIVVRENESGIVLAAQHFYINILLVYILGSTFSRIMYIVKIGLSFVVS